MYFENPIGQKVLSRLEVLRRQVRVQTRHFAV